MEIRRIGLFGLILFSAGNVWAQGTASPATKTLVVNGRTVGAELKVIDGHSYVDIETLAQITNGVVTVEPNRIVLTIPDVKAGSTVSASTQGPSAPGPSVEGPGAPGLSKNFAIA